MALWDSSPLFFKGLRCLERSQLTGSWQKLFQCYDLIIKIVGDMSLHGFYLTVNVTETEKEIEKEVVVGRKRDKSH